MSTETDRLLDLLDELCQDSLEIPLGAVEMLGTPEEGEITSKFREARDLVMAIVARELREQLEHKALYAEMARLPNRDAAAAFGRVREYVERGGKT